jgi:hypothetical protein
MTPRAPVVIGLLAAASVLRAASEVAFHLARVVERV